MCYHTLVCVHPLCKKMNRPIIMKTIDFSIQTLWIRIDRQSIYIAVNR
jgi:hypothetical protein